MHEDYRANCVLKCQSEACYAEVYGAEELEPGEIDNVRQREFSKCLSMEQRNELKNRRTAATTRKATKSAAGEGTSDRPTSPSAESDEQEEL